MCRIEADVSGTSHSSIRVLLGRREEPGLMLCFTRLSSVFKQPKQVKSTSRGLPGFQSIVVMCRIEADVSGTSHPSIRVLLGRREEPGLMLCARRLAEAAAADGCSRCRLAHNFPPLPPPSPLKCSPAIVDIHVGHVQEAEPASRHSVY